MRLLHYCGLPVDDVDFINSDGKAMNKLLLEVGFPDMIDLLFLFLNIRAYTQISAIACFSES
jgi:hypothetical protein